MKKNDDLAKFPSENPNPVLRVNKKIENRVDGDYSSGSNFIIIIPQVT